MNAGRTRGLIKGEVLDKAMRVFWEGGCAGTSLADLTAASGINRPNVLLGNKEKL